MDSDISKICSALKRCNDKIVDKKNAYALKTPHVIALPFIYGVESLLSFFLVVYRT